MCSTAQQMEWPRPGGRKVSVFKNQNPKVPAKVAVAGMGSTSCCQPAFLRKAGSEKYRQARRAKGRGEAGRQQGRQCVKGEGRAGVRETEG